MKFFLTLLLSWLPGGLLLAEVAELRAIVELREQGKFEAAEQQTARLLAGSLSDEARFELSLEHARLATQRALAAPAEQQEEHWQRAQAIVDDFVGRQPQHPKLLLMLTQGALLELARGERAREDAELDGGEQASLDAARQRLRSAIARLSQLHQDVETRLHAALRTAGRSRESLTASELESLALHMRLYWARALVEQALSYGPTSADRLNSLSRAIEVLRPLAKLEITTALGWSARLLEIKCLRMIEDTTAAAHQLQGLAQAAPPAELQGLLRAERTRLALARGQLDEAFAEAAPGAPRGESNWTEADLALLETYLAAWAQADDRHDPTRAAEWEQAATDQVAGIARHYGLRIARRADLLLARQVGARRQAARPATQFCLAQGLERSGKSAAAVAAYDQVAELSRASGQTDLAFSAGSAAAQLEQRQRHFREASDRLRALALGGPEHPRASEAHLLAIHNAAQQARSEPAAPLDAYRQLLVEHLTTWPDAATAAQARSWLGRLYEHEGNDAAAIEVLRQIKSDAPRFVEVVEALGRVYQRALGRLRAQGRPTAALANSAIDYFDAIAAPRGKPPRPWTTVQRAAVIAEARILLRGSPEDAHRAEQLSASALEGEPRPDPAVERNLQALRIAALATAGRTEPAAQAWRHMSAASDTAALELVETLSELSALANRDRQAALARLELSIVADLLAEGPRPAEVARTLSRRRAELLALTGRRDEALRAMRKLAAEFPADGPTQEALAGLLSTGEGADLRAAVDQWREVAGKCRPGSPRWWRANYGLAQAQLAIGQPAECLATIEHTAGTPGDGAGPELKAKMEELRRRCAQATSRWQRNAK